MKLRRRESGRVFVLAAFGLVVILAFTALASDLGYSQSQRRKMQTAADSADMAGEQEVIACDTASVTAAAKNDATLNGFTARTDAMGHRIGNRTPPVTAAPVATPINASPATMPAANRSPRLAPSFSDSLAPKIARPSAPAKIVVLSANGR